ncbi:hypothetical protein [Zhongshania borealis]|uniref:Uncharacterized protein n=1 Tax=Zhongshania borealis TaxID=889488 RepID=A0ABP7WEA3_9GAMM
MKTIKLKGAGARNFFAERMVDQHGNEALNQTAGPMKKAVQEVIDMRLSSRGTGVDLRDVVGPLSKS